MAGRKNDTGEIILKVVNITGQAQDAAIQLNSGPVSLNASVTVLTSAQPGDENSFDHPTQVVPKDADVGVVASAFDYTFAPYSITVLHLKTR